MTAIEQAVNVERPETPSWRRTVADADARAVRRRSRFSLRFDDAALEHQFLHAFDSASLPLVRAGTALGIALAIAFGFLDFWLVGEDVLAALIVRTVMVLGLVAVLWSQYQSWWNQIQRFVVPIGSVAIAILFDLMTLVSPMPDGYAALATMMTIVFLCTLIRTTFEVAALGTAMMVAAYAITATIAGEDIKTFVYYLAFMSTFVSTALGGCCMLERVRRNEFLAELELADAHRRSDALLHNIFPDQIADQLRSNPAAIATTADDVSVIFADIVDFTPLSAALTPTDLVRLLDDLFCRFDAMCDEHRIEKIKTIGDAYMAVAGVPASCDDHATVAAEMALDMLQAAQNFHGWPGDLTLRIGISSGPVVAGVIGHRKFAYDLWGDTVNTASRMESHGTPGLIQVSEKTFRLLRDRYVFSSPLTTTVKGKGTMTTYYLLSRLDCDGAVASADPT